MALIAFLLASVMIGVGGALAVDQAAPAVGVLRLDPSPAVGVTGGEVDVSVITEGVSDVYGIEFTLDFDAGVLNVIDANPGASGVQITPGSCPAPDFVASNWADNAGGNIGYAATQLNPTPPCGGGEAAVITFRCLPGMVEKVTTTVTILSSVVSDPDGTAIPHDPINGTVECEANIFFIDGEVALQSWPDPTGAQVVLRDSAGAVVEGPINVESDGLFQFQGLVGNVYSVEASYPRYLSAVATGITSGTVGEHVNLGMTTLRAGDINGDGVINILDISGVAGNFSKTSPQNWVP
jgi:hypothetical protein